MSSDGYFEDDMDSGFLDAVDAIEAAHVHPTNRIQATKQRLPLERSVIEIGDSDDDYESPTLNEDALQVFDQVCASESSRTPHTNALPTKPASRSKTSMGTIQTNLFGQIVSESTSGRASNSSRKPMSRSNSSSRNPLVFRPKKTKQWDHAGFAKSGWKRPKGKEKAFHSDEDDEEEGTIEFEQFPSPPAIFEPPPPMKLKPDLLAARRWLYPLNKPKRDYQFNIVKRCLFDNTLVAIPTGLGKTFIAGVVMLNFYTWFPEGKVVFVAPTRPLVAQQIEACHQTCGIPGSHAVELTGNNPRAMRARAWQEKRVFYMTPQTLMNDLRTNNCDCRDIVLVVVDEAHKGTGDYAYAQVVRYLMAKNPHFRLLALTATPGSTPEAVQTVVDSLHISHVEIRDEESLDLRRYMHEKRVEQHIIPMNSDILKISDLLAAVMQPMINRLQSTNIIRGMVDPKTLHPYRCQVAMGELKLRRDNQPWAYGPLATLGSLARAMGYLHEGSTSMAYTSLKGLLDDSTEANKKPSKLQQDPAFQALMREIEVQRARGFSTHPKREKMLGLIVQHFGTRMPDGGDTEAGIGDASRVMVFSTFRENVDELVILLNQHNPLIRAVRFIGQGTDKQGRKGYAQKEQMEVIKKFKSGEYNVLVSTSVGEEGLDIGEVDMIICYESQKTPIRMLQRIGRTGRKKDGVVHVLLAEGREDRNWDKAKENYQQVQHFIVRADQLELYDDVGRLLPNHVRPECVEMTMDIEEYNREEAAQKKKPSAKSRTAVKRGHADNPTRNIPPGASTGFVSVKDLIVKGTRKRGPLPTFDPLACEDDDDDRSIMEGIHGSCQAASPAVRSKPTKVKKPRRSSTTASTSTNKRRGVKPPKKAATIATVEMSSSQLERLLDDDSDDKEIEGGLFGAEPYPRAAVRPRSPSIPSRKSSSSPDALAEGSPFEGHRLSSPPNAIRVGSRIYSTDRAIIEIPSTPPRPLSSPTRAASPSRALPSVDVTAPDSPPHGKPADPNIAWLVEDDDEPSVQVLEPPSASKALVSRTDDPDSSVEFLGERRSQPLPRPGQRPSKSISSRFPNRSRETEGMPPPALPVGTSFASPEMSDAPTSTFTVRPPGKRLKKRTLQETIDSSPQVVDGPSHRRVLRHWDVSSPIPIKKRKLKFKDTAEAQKHNPWVDFEAGHSGDDCSIGSSGPEEDVEQYDLSFVQDIPGTQVSPSYNQTAVYRQSLFSQAPGGAIDLPVFMNRPAKRGARTPSSHRYYPRSSSPKGTDDEQDEYEFGSFIVADDEEISYLDEPSVEL